MTERIMQSGWAKDIVKIVAGGLIALVPGIVAYGSLQATTAENTRRLNEHVEVYTPNVYREFVAVQKEVTALKSDKEYLEKSLKKMEDQNAEILRILRQRR